MATALQQPDFLRELFERFGIPASYLSHLRELRQRLLRVFYTLIFFYGLFFLFRFEPVANAGPVPIYAPVFSPFAPAASQILGRMIEDLMPSDIRFFGDSPATFVILFMQISLVMALACSMPMILYQFGKFVMPALYPHERRELVRLVVPGVGLFAAGAAFAYTVLVPPIVNFLFEYLRQLHNTPEGSSILLQTSLGDAIQFAIMIVLAFGFVFELPLVMSLLTRLGVVASTTWWRYWRHATVGFLIVGGVITPDTSGVTQLLVALPMMALYFAGAGMATVSERRRRKAA